MEDTEDTTFVINSADDLIPEDPDPGSSSERDPTQPIPMPFYGPHLPGGEAATGDAEENWDLPSTSTSDTTGASSSSLDWQLALDDNEHRYVGLVNQAMTCYLNSLLQTLYMTPEFRNALYKWEFTGSKAEEEKNIPYQLQKLFLLLQTTDRYSLETKELTRSFGWDSNAAWDQHDVQELFRVMFDALETKWRRSRQATLIQELYKGCMRDYVKCLQCKRENAREDVFLDLPLAVKPFGASANEAYKSVEEALSAFVHPELLEGANQYECEYCKTKTDAHKGLKITRFPYMLTIQLKRFDFNYLTLHRVKLNDRMTFPDCLNLNPFVDGEETATGTEAEQMEVGDGEGRHEDEDEGISLNDSNRSSPEGVFPKEENLIVGQIDPNTVKKYLSDGPYVYELFSIMVHSGSANGGHYYAFIKNMDQDKWYCFNDSSVRTASIDELLRSYGGHSGGWAFSNTNAYMLMYRQMDANRNDHFIRTAGLPSHLLAMLERIKKEEDEAKAIKEYLDSLIKVDVQCEVPGKGIEKDAIELVNTEPLNALLSKAHHKFKLSSHGVPLDCCRFILFDTYWSSTVTLSHSIEDRMDDPVNSAFTTWSKNIFLETKMPGQEWTDASEKGKTICVRQVDLDNESVLPDRFVMVPNDATSAKAQQIFAQKLGGDPTKIRTVIEKCNQFTYLDEPEKPFSSIINGGFYMGAVAYVDPGFNTPAAEEDRRIQFSHSALRRVIDRYNNLVNIKIRIPSNADFQRAALPPPPFLLDDGDSTNTSMSYTYTDFVSAASLLPSSEPCVSISVSSEHHSSSSCLITPDPSPQVSPSVSPNVPTDTNDWEQGTNTDTDMSDRNANEEGEGDDTSSKCTIKGEEEEEEDYPEPDESLLVETSSNGNNLEVPDDRSGAATPLVSVNYFQTEQIETDADGKFLNMQADGRMHVSDLKTHLALLLQISEEEFTIKKLLGNSGQYDISSYTQTLKQVSGVEALSVALGRPLQSGEQLVHIRKFDLAEKEEKFTHLFDLVIHEDDTIQQILEQCVTSLDKICGINTTSDKLRLFEPVDAAVKTLERRNKLYAPSAFRNKEAIYLQILDEPDPILSLSEGVYHKCVFARRWFPSSVTYGPVLYLCLAFNGTMKEAAEQIHKHTKIPVERIEIANENRWSFHLKFPFERERLELLEKMSFDPADSDHTLDIGQGQMIHFRDSSEAPKPLTSEERRQIQIKDNNTMNAPRMATWRRKERPLKIWASSSICEDDLD